MSLKTRKRKWEKVKKIKDKIKKETSPPRFPQQAQVPFGTGQAIGTRQSHSRTKLSITHLSINHEGFAQG